MARVTKADHATAGGNKLMSQVPMAIDPNAPSVAFLRQLERETKQRIKAAPAFVSSFAGAPPTLADSVEITVDALAGEISDLAHALHSEPEIAFKEFRSSAKLVEALASHGIDAQLGVHGLATAIRAEVGVNAGPTIAILSEYDALPDVGHACGHNVIAAAGLGAFIALSQLLAVNPEAFNGRVVFLGTPGEEGYSGKEIMARNGAFDGIDAAIMVHPYGYDLAEQVWLGRRLLTVTFEGVAAHASAQPFMGRNALDAANLVYQAVGLLRQQLPAVDRVHVVISDGGNRPNVITAHTVLKMYARSKYVETLRDLSERLNDIARGAALMTGTSVNIEWDEYPPSLPVRTNEVLTERWVLAQQRRGRNPLPAGVVSEIFAASTDFGNVSHRIPGIHPLIKISPPEVTLHTTKFATAANSREGETGAVDGACGLALTALDFLCDPKIQQAVAEEFAARGGAIDVKHYFD